MASSYAVSAPRLAHKSPTIPVAFESSVRAILARPASLAKLDGRSAATAMKNNNGKSIQKTGFSPDIIFSKSNNLERESKLINALIPDQVKGLKLTPLNDLNIFKSIILKGQKRVNENKKNIYIEQNQNYTKDLMDFKILSPSKIIDEIKRLSAKYKIESDTAANDLEFAPTAIDQKLFKRKQYIQNERNKWYSKLKVDFQVEESFNILMEMNQLTK